MGGPLRSATQVREKGQALFACCLRAVRAPSVPAGLGKRGELREVRERTSLGSERGGDRVLGDQPEVLDGVSGLLLAHGLTPVNLRTTTLPSGGAVGAQMRVESLNFACPTGLYVPQPRVRVGYPRAGSASI